MVRDFFDTTHHRRKKSPVRHRHDDANDVTSTIAQGSGNMVGLIVKFLRCL